MKLNNSNYFSREAGEEYMSASQFKAFSKCEAAALAEIRGDYVRPISTALLTGSYIDAHFEGSLDVFKAQHPELFKRDGGLKAEYSQAEETIGRIERDELFMLLMSGAKQVIKTGEIGGIPFKIKIDSLLDGGICREIVRRFPETAEVFGLCEGAIIDLKYMKDVAPVWVDGLGRAPFAEAWGYDIQGAVYQAVDNRMLPFILAVATKETPAGLHALSIEQPELDAKLMEVEELAPRYQAIKQGLLEPERCENCPYCRETRKLARIVNYKMLDAWEGEDE